MAALELPGKASPGSSADVPEGQGSARKGRVCPGRPGVNVASGRNGPSWFAGSDWTTVLGQLPCPLPRRNVQYDLLPSLHLTLIPRSSPSEIKAISTMGLELEQMS